LPEIFGSASYYGIGKILRQYSNFPAFLPLPVNVQHGFLGRRVTQHDALKTAPENWYWDEGTLKSHLKFFQGITGRTVGAPFLYLLGSINYSQFSFAERSGTIVFPAHSSAFVKVSSDFNSFADQLSQLPEEFHPITVCAYHIDFERGDYQPFIDRGYEIVTNGNSLYDSSFLYNFINNVKDKKFTISNSHSSTLYYSSAMGVMAYHLGPVPEVDHRDPHKMDADLQGDEKHCLDGFREFFAFPNANFKIQHNFVMEMLGQDYLLDPKEMKKLLWRKTFTFKYLVALLRTLMFCSLAPLKKSLRRLGFSLFKENV